MVSLSYFRTMLRHFGYILILHNIVFSSVTKQMIRNDSEIIILELNIEANTESDLFPISILIGLPNEEIPTTLINYENESIIPFNTQQKADIGFEWVNRQRLQGLETATLRLSPVINEESYHKRIIIKIEFIGAFNEYRTPYSSEIELLQNRVINWSIAKDWIQKDEFNLNRMTDLPIGRWFQFFLNKDEISAIKFSLLDSLIEDISEIDPRSFSIYMNQELGRPRVNSFNQPLLDNLTEISILVTGEDDGSFDNDDKIIFYGRGPSGFDFSNNDLEWNQNIYFTSNSCWLLIPDNMQLRGKRVTEVEQPQSGILLDYGISSHHLESDLINLDASGTEWVGNPIPSGGSQPIVLDLPTPKIGADISILARFRGHSLTETSLSNHQLSIRYGNVNGEQLGSLTDWTGNSSRQFSTITQGLDLDDGMNIFYVKNLSTDANSYPYLDYFQLHYSRELHFEQSYEFLAPISNEDLRFFFTGQRPSDIRLWDISDPSNIASLDIDDQGYCNVSPQSNDHSRLIIFTETNLNYLSEIIPRNNQSFEILRQTGLQADYLVIGPSNFKDKAEDLLALRNPAVYADIEQIYLEFSSGNPDPLAIRSFIQWTQERWLPPYPSCALFLGDAGYDYRNITGQSTIIVPTIQVQSSRTYATDDLLAAVYGNIPEIATGRFPARNEQEVVNFVDKVINLETDPELGPWRQRITLIADDAARPEPKHGSINTGKSHTLNSEQLASVVPPSIYIDKIYMMEFPEVSDASAYGVIKPGATEALFNALSTGTAIISYIGHGSPYQLAQEKLLDMNRGDLNQINTGNKLPIWIVGTCSFGHFDDPITESFAEELIRSPMNAAAMVIATSRPITVVGNERYTLDIFEKIFENNNVSEDKVGIILQSIKDGTSESQYFHLFGDPAMKLPMPFDTLTTLNISPDTLKTLETAYYYGEQNSIAGNGSGYVIMKDAPRHVTREYEISSETYSLSYILPGATLFRGQFSFSDQTIDGEIRIPQDISYSKDPASLLIYIHNEQNEARSAISTIFLSGGSPTDDNFGPQISFENEHGTILEYGDHFSKNGHITIRFSDPLGINLTNETGHEIIINDLSILQSTIATNEFFYEQNSITTGTIIYNANDELVHIRVKAWDNANNPSEKEVKLFKSSNNVLQIYNAYNFPNPFFSSTQFCFEVTEVYDLKLDIYSLGGRKIWSYTNHNLNAGYNTVEWHGNDSFNGKIANGVYIYRIKAIGNNSTVSYIGKCAKYH